MSNNIKLRQQLAKRDGLTCHWCGRLLRLDGATWKGAPEDFATVDRLERGGEYTLSNTVLACRNCNAGRHAGRENNPEK